MEVIKSLDYSNGFSINCDKLLEYMSTNMDVDISISDTFRQRLKKCRSKWVLIQELAELQRDILSFMLLHKYVSEGEVSLPEWKQLHTLSQLGTKYYNFLSEYYGSSNGKGIGDDWKELVWIKEATDYIDKKRPADIYMNVIQHSDRVSLLLQNN